MTPDLCPHCGAPVPDGAPACPGCGADEQTGWSSGATAQRLGLPGDEEFDHDRFVREEFGGAAPLRHGLPAWLLWITAALLLAALGWWWW